MNSILAKMFLLILCSDTGHYHSLKILHWAVVIEMGHFNFLQDWNDGGFLKANLSRRCSRHLVFIYFLKILDLLSMCSGST